MDFVKGWKRFLNEAEEEEETLTFRGNVGDYQSDYEETEEYKRAEADKYSSDKDKARELHFGKNPDEIPCVEEMRSNAGRAMPPSKTQVANFFQCMAELGYEDQGAGSFRAVFTLPGREDLVLKVVSPKNQTSPKLAIDMNRKEAQGAFQTTSELVPRVYDSARDHYWIISEKVDIIKQWNEMQSFFPAWKDEDPDKFQYWFQTLIDPRVKEDVAIKHIKRTANQYQIVNSAEDLVNDPLIIQIRDLLAKFNLPSWDIRPFNVGHATRDGKNQFVIVDPGFGLGKDRGEIEGMPKDSFDIKDTGDIFKDQEKYAQTWEPPVNKNIPATQHSNLNEVLTKQWSLFLENRGPHDFLYDISKSNDKIVISLLDPATREPVPSKKEGTNAFISLEKRTDVPNWEVSWASSPADSGGVGTIMYLMALEHAEGGLAPDSYETSPDARRIWEKFMGDNPYGVNKELKDGHEGEDESDPFNFVFFKPEKTILDKYSNRIIEKEADTEENDDFDPEKEEKVEYFDPNTDLDDYLRGIDEGIDELYENLMQDEDTNEVSKVIIADESGKILILRRSDKENMWDLPGGHLKTSENAEDGAFREVKEETNLDISDLNSLNTHENTHFFKCGAPKGQIKLRREEHNDFMWVNPKDIDQYDMKKHLKDAIFNAFEVVAENNEPYQRFSRGTYRKFIAKLAKQGKNKYNVGGVMQKPSTKHLKSGPPGI